MMALSSNKGCCQIFAIFVQGLPNLVTINTSSAASISTGRLHGIMRWAVGQWAGACKEMRRDNGIARAKRKHSLF